MNQENKKVLGYTLGCRLNQADTALIFGRLEKDGYTVIKPGKDSSPDLIIVNTCTVTANAAQKSRQTARSFRKKYPDACIVVSGCDCEKGIGEWEKEPAVDLIIPNAEKKNVSRLVSEWKEQKKKAKGAWQDIRRTDFIEIPHEEKDLEIDVSFRENAVADYPFKSRAFLKVQEGCNAFCTYCIVPYVRGRERSRKLYEVIDEAKAFIDKGHREIVITGVNICTYKDGDIGLPDLVEKIISLPGNFRVRLSSMEPHPDNKDLIDLIASSEKLCRFLHIPLQHGTDTILKSMGRNYTTAKFAEFMNEAAEKVEGIHLGTDVIVGFPGENDELFAESCNFISSLPIANAHIFRFSPRKGTPAADFQNQIPQRITKTRAGILEKITNEMKDRFFQSQKGKTLKVLVETQMKDGSYSGWSDNYIRGILTGNDLAQGEFAEWTVS